MDIKLEHRIEEPIAARVSGYKNLMAYSNEEDFRVGEENRYVNKRSKEEDDGDLKSPFRNFFDSMTEATLSGLHNDRYFSEFYGCISSGKEAKVYLALKNLKPVVKRYAIKVYFQTNLIFKRRGKYTDGNFKVRRGWNKNNTKNMVHNWAESEYRNLHTLYYEGLPVPKPKVLRENVLIMEYLGTEDSPAPRLQAANLSVSRARKLYVDIVNNMWIMYRKCQLVHGDLSEYNLLYHKEKAYIIDVSQSVSPAHPAAQELLCKDCSSVTDFFRKRGVPTLTLEDLYDYIADSSVTEFNRSERLKVLLKAASNIHPRNISQKLRLEEKLFKDVYITNCLSAAVDYERYISSSTKEQSDLEVDEGFPETEDDSESESESEKNEFSDESDSDDDTEKLRLEATQKLDLKKKRRPEGRPKNETAAQKKERKKLFKENNKKINDTISWHKN